MLTRRIAPERQAHRPLVPNVPQGAVVYDRPLRSPPAIINQPIITQVAKPQTHGTSRDSHAVVDQSRNESSMLDSQYQKQPISEQNAANYRQMFMQMQQQNQATIAQNANVSLNDQTASNCPNVYHPQFHALFQQNPHQVNQQTQQSVYGQQMLPQALNQVQPISHQQHHIHNNSGVQCSHYNQQTISQGQGMTSPQDMTISQMRLMRHNLSNHQQNLGHSVNLQPARPQNDKWMQMTNQNQQHLHQQSPSQWQYYYQAHDTNFSQQNPGDQAQSNPSQNLANQKPTGQSTTEAHGHREGKKTLQFTSDMIRDQELLVSTMRQQGVPEEVMRRQFDALLNEQKRHLTYIAQFQQQQQKPDISEESKKTRLARRKTEKDEKPDWMIHITPPRISYSDIERMNAQQRASNEQYPMDDKSPGKMADQQKNYAELKKEEICNQVSPQQMYTQVNPQLWQTANWPHRSDCQASCGHTACYGHQQNASNITCPPTFKYVQYPYKMRYNPYLPHFESQVSKECNPSSMNPTDNQGTSIPQDPAYQQSRRPIETSSLLKMRVYKELICPQKRNNGLQDPENIQKMLEALKDPTSKKGLEYLANLIKKKPIVKLNGIQNSNEIPENMQPRPAAEIPSQFQKRISVNGLENKRHPNNPPSRVRRPKRADEPLMAEYPRQKQNAKNCYSMQAEKENSTTLQNQDALSYVQNAHRSIPYDRQNVPITQGCHGNNMVFQYGEGAVPHYHQMQQYYLNGQNLPGHNGGQGDVVCMQQPDAPGATRIDRAGGDTGEKPNTEDVTKRISGAQAMQETNAYGQPEIHETRTIGGITYLARKPERAPNNLAVSPDKLIASGI